MCEAAISCGLKGIAFTDHCETNKGISACLKVIKGLKSDVKRARDIFGDKLEISLGIELGQPHHDLSLSHELLCDGEIDFVIGSLHHARGQQDYYYIDYDHEDIDMIMYRYYDELMELVECGCYDVIGHINYQLRYMSAVARNRGDLSKYYRELGAILDVVAKNNKGIEINSSGLWRGIDLTLPPLEVIKMFRAVGGEIVTTGSDSHDASHVGAAIDSAVECLRDAGFERCAFFKQRKPIFKAI
jgi:histidinol-phosphatase (PHP family)